MEKLIEFVGNNYAWFLTITILLLFALIGYIYDTKRSKNDLMSKNEEEMNATDLENISVPEGKSLADMVTSSKNINAETKNVELVDETILNKPETQSASPLQDTPEEPTVPINETPTNGN